MICRLGSSSHHHYLKMHCHTQYLFTILLFAFIMIGKWRNVTYRTHFFPILAEYTKTAQKKMSWHSQFANEQLRNMNCLLKWMNSWWEKTILSIIMLINWLTQIHRVIFLVRVFLWMDLIFSDLQLEVIAWSRRIKFNQIRFSNKSNWLSDSIRILDYP